MDRLASITAFVRVAANGGFSAAARSLNVSPTTVSDQVQALETAAPPRGKRVMIRFDDGCEDNLLWAAPLLRKHGFTAVVFVATDFLGKPGFLRSCAPAFAEPG